MRRPLIIALGVLAIAAVAAGGTVLGLALTESDEPDLGFLHARALSSKLALVGRIRVTLSRKPPNLTKAQESRILSQEPNEGQVRRGPAPAGATPTPAASGEPAASASQSGLSIFTNTKAYRRTGDGPIASFIAEPHLATDGRRVLLTWNWGTAVSDNGGQSFPFFLDPFSLEKRRGSKKTIVFCCDQLAYYAPRSGARPGLWIWIVQAGHRVNGREQDNLIRVLWQRAGKRLNQRLFRYRDFLAQRDFHLPSGYWLDQPRIAATKGHLFFSIDTYNASNQFYDSYVIRLGLADLARGRPRPRILKSKVSDPIGFTQGAKDTMFFAGHPMATKLRVWRWADSSPNPNTPVDVSHGAYFYARHVCRRTTTTQNWCGRGANDLRITAGWVAKGIVGFAWNAPAVPDDGYPYPYVGAVQLDEDTLAVRDEPSIFFKDRAVQYAALAPNARGEIGGVALIGAGTFYESCAALVWDPTSDPQTTGWDYRVIDASDSDPGTDVQAGDYVGAVATRPSSNAWAGSCMTLHGGGFDNRTEDDVEIRFATFGRAADAP
jgi:hypothetical protein